MYVYHNVKERAEKKKNLRDQHNNCRSNKQSDEKTKNAINFGFLLILNELRTKKNFIRFFLYQDISWSSLSNYQVH